MAVAFDANASAVVTGTGVTSITSSNLTVGGGSNRAVVCQLVLSFKTPTGESVNWDQTGTPQAMTSIIAANGTGTIARAELWGLVNPTAGAKQAKAAWTGASDVYINCTSFTGVDQTGGATTFPNSTSGTGTRSGATPFSLSITSAAGNMTVAAIALDIGSLSTPTQTQTFLSNALACDGAASRAVGAASVAHAWNGDTNGGHWVIVGTDMLASAASGAIAGVAAILFGGTNTLLGAGALAGVAPVVFGNNAVINGAAPLLAGNATVTFGGTNTLSGAGALAGIAPILFGGTNSLVGAGALLGTAGIVFGGSATADVPSGSLAGVISILFGGTNALTGSGALAGNATITFSQNAVINGAAALAGAASILFGSNAVISNGVVAPTGRSNRRRIDWTVPFAEPKEELEILEQTIDSVEEEIEASQIEEETNPIGVQYLQDRISYLLKELDSLAKQREKLRVIVASIERKDYEGERQKERIAFAKWQEEADKERNRLFLIETEQRHKREAKVAKLLKILNIVDEIEDEEEYEMVPVTYKLVKRKK